MKKINLLFILFIITITCTGCSIEYNINITEKNIEETIIVDDYITSNRTKNDILTHYNMWYPVFVNYITEGETIELTDFSQKVNGIEYYEKSINEINSGYRYNYKYNYKIDEYYDSYALASSFIDTTVHETGTVLVLKTSKKNLLCNYDYFDSLKINISIDPKAYKLNYTNTTNINNNTYTWNFNRNDCENSQIVLTLDKINDVKPYAEPKEEDNLLSRFALYIFFGIIIILILIGYSIYNKIKIKNANLNEDD